MVLDQLQGQNNRAMFEFGSFSVVLPCPEVISGFIHSLFEI